MGTSVENVHGLRGAQEEMYEAPWLAIGLTLLILYRRACKWAERRQWGDFTASKRFWAAAASPIDFMGLTQRKALLPFKERSYAVGQGGACFLAFHYFVPMYIVFFYLLVDQIFTVNNLLGRTDGLNPYRLRAAFRYEAALPSWWENELENMLDPNAKLLRWFSMTSPLFLVATFGVSLWNTWRHVKEVYKRGGGVVENAGHDSAILIIALPLIYCIMAHESVVRMWMVVSNTKSDDLVQIVDFNGKATWEARLVMAQLIVKTNFMVADLYEAWALFQFAWLTITVIRIEHSKRFSYTEGRADPEVAQMIRQDQDSIQQLTMQGVNLFILSCLLESIYYLVTTTIEILFSRHVVSFTMKVYSMREQVHFFFLGMGTIASSAAIGNVITVEMTFHDLLHSFLPATKFWSTKVLVSIAFLQSLALLVPPLSSLSVTEQLLAYSSLLCLECFFVSLLHLKAWHPQEEWYSSLSSRKKSCRSSATAGDRRLKINSLKSCKAQEAEVLLLSG